MTQVEQARAFELAETTALVLGVGDGLEQAITRELADAGASTLTVGPNAESDIGQHGTDVPHWRLSEDDVDERVVTRVMGFLTDQNRVPDVVIAQVDVMDHAARRRPSLWDRLRRRRPLDTVMFAHLGAVIAALPPQTDCSIVVVFRMRRDLREGDVYGWLEYVMRQIIERGDHDGGHGVRANAVLLGDDDVFAEAAHIVAFLASPYSARISGAFIPVDDGRLLRRSA